MAESEENSETASRARAHAIDAYRSGGTEHALAQAGRAVQFEGDGADSLLVLGVVQGWVGGSVQALPALEQAVACAPGAAAPRQARALMLARLGRRSEAVAELRRAVVAALLRQGVTAGSCPSAVFAASAAEIAQAQAGAGQGDDAIKTYRAALAAQAAQVSALVSLGHLYRDQGHPETAIRLLRDAIDHQPGNPDLHEALGDLLVAAGQTQEAAAEFRVALAARPHAPETARRLARRTTGAEAIGAWRRVLQALPQDGEALSHLATALFEQADHTVEALALARRWFVVSNGDPAARSLLDHLTKK